jgi:hypothetical protein
MERTPPLRVVVTCESGRLFAQCLEHDIVTSGDSLDELHINFLTVLASESELGLDRIPAAPPEFEALWRKAEPAAAPERKNSHQIDYRQAA